MNTIVGSNALVLPVDRGSPDSTWLGRIQAMALAALALMVGMPYAFGAAPYTNTWNTVEGLTHRWNWNDSANWSVQYGASTPAPVSAVPTAQSLTYLDKEASISLQPGDDMHLGETYFLASVFDRTLNVTIPAGARMSLDGTALTSFFGTERWREGASVNNKTTVDVNGGEFVLGQNVFTMRANTCTAYDNPPLNHVVVRNGGVISVTNGSIHVLGGESSESTGKGCFTNVIDVLAGSELRFSGPSYLQFGDFALHRNYGVNMFSSGGYLNVRGGRVDFGACTEDVCMSVGGHSLAGCGTYITVSDGGIIDFGGKTLNVNTANTNVLRVVSGGVVTNLEEFSVSNGGGNAASYHNMIDVDGGRVRMNNFTPGIHTAGINGRTTFRIRGDADRSRLTINCAKTCVGWYYNNSGTPPWFLDCRLSAHTPRTARFPMCPLVFVAECWTDGGDVSKIHGINRISPDGGFQIVHATKGFTLVAHRHDSGGFSTDNTYRFIGEDMWSTNIGVIGNDSDEAVRDLVEQHTYAYALTADLREDARLNDGEVLANPVPRAWFALPGFSAKMLDTNRYERISVRLALLPQASATLESLVADMKACGQDGAVIDETVAPYNVRVDLPVSELAENVSTDSIVMDFVKVDTYAQANGVVPFQTNALIRAVTCETRKIDRGLCVIFR